jgi:hypothetical protein
LKQAFEVLLMALNFDQIVPVLKFFMNQKSPIMIAMNYFGIIICGICLGILTGISISPIIQSIITSLITIIVAILSLSVGINAGESSGASSSLISKHKLVNVFPTTMFILFFTLGSFGGIKMRTSNLFGDSPRQHYSELSDIGFSNDEIKQILLKKYLGEDSAEAMQTLHETVLFSNKIKDRLDLLRLKSGKQLEIELIALNVPAIDSFLNITNDSISIEALKVFLCTKK